MAILLQSENHVSYQKELATDPQFATLLKEILQSFKNEEREQESRRAKIRDLAKRMEELKMKYGLGIEVNKICSEICQAYRRAKIPESQIRDVYRAFDMEGYHIYTERAVFGKSLAITGNLPEENVIRFSEVKEQFNKLLNEDFRHFTKPQVQEIYDMFEKGYDKYTDICEDNNIPTVSSGNSSHQFYKMQEDNEKYPNKIETPNPGYEWTELSDAWKGLGDDCYEIARQCADFPPQIKSQAHKIAQGVNVFRQFLLPGKDKKHKRSILDWVENVKTTINASINGTATLHPTESNLCAYCSQPDVAQDPTGKNGLRKPVTMKPHELNEPILQNRPDPGNEEEVKVHNKAVEAFKMRFMSDHGLDFENEDDKRRISRIIEEDYFWLCPQCKGVSRREIIVSREHTSDMIKPTLNLVTDIINHIPVWVSFCKWYAEWRRPILDSQTINLSPKLKNRKSG